MSDDYEYDLNDAFWWQSGLSFNPGAGESIPEEYELSIRLLKARHAVEEFRTYADEEIDIDLSEARGGDIRDIDDVDRMVLNSFSALNSAYIELAQQFEDDDSENPFKVSDGDDPIY